MTGDVATTYAGIQARIGLMQLSKLDDMLAKRRALVDLYNRELNNVPRIRLSTTRGRRDLFSLHSKCPSDRADLKQYMANRGIAVDESFDYALRYLSTAVHWIISCFCSSFSTVLVH